MDMRIFTRYFFTKQGQLKVIPTELAVDENTSTTAASRRIRQNPLPEATSTNLAAYKTEIETIITDIQSINEQATEEDVEHIEVRIDKLPLRRWREELAYYTSQIRQFLTLPEKFHGLQEAVEQGNHPQLNRKLPETEGLIAAYPFDDKSEWEARFQEIKDQAIPQELVAAIKERIDLIDQQLADVEDGPMTIDDYKQLVAEEKLLKADMKTLVKVKETAPLFKKSTKLSRSIAGLKEKLYPLLHDDISPEEYEQILVLLEVPPVNLIQDKQRLVQFLMEEDEELFRGNEKETIQLLGALSLIMESSRKETIDTGLIHLGIEDYINLGRDNRLEAAGRFFQKYSGELESFSNAAQVIEAATAIIEQFQADFSRLNQALTPGEMAEALEPFDLPGYIELGAEQKQTLGKLFLLKKQDNPFRSITEVRKTYQQVKGSIKKTDDALASAARPDESEAETLTLGQNLQPLEDQSIRVITSQADTGKSWATTVTLLEV